MVAIVKFKSFSIKSKIYPNQYETALDDFKVVWIYNSIDLYVSKLHKSGKYLKGNLTTRGYYSVKGCYCINLSFKGVKDNSYLLVEKELRPIIRDKKLNIIFN